MTLTILSNMPFVTVRYFFHLCAINCIYFLIKYAPFIKRTQPILNVFRTSPREFTPVSVLTVPFNICYSDWTSLIFPNRHLTALVGRVGVDPTIPEGAGFTVRCSCRFTTYPFYKIPTILNKYNSYPTIPFFTGVLKWNWTTISQIKSLLFYH